jgi:hypothetical protein
MSILRQISTKSPEMEWGWKLESVVQITGLPASERDLGPQDFEATHAELTGEAAGAVADCAAYKPLRSKSPKGGELGAADRAQARAANPRSTTKEPTAARIFFLVRLHVGYSAMCGMVR